MAKLVDESEDIVEMDEEAPRKKKKRRLTSTTDVGDPSSSQPTKKTGRRLDPVWKYVEKLKSGFKCKYCGEEYSGGASRIKTHLGVGNGTGIKRCEKFKKRKKKKKKKRRHSSPIVQESADNAETSLSPGGEIHYDDGDIALSLEGERQSHDVDMTKSLEGERQSDPEPPSDLNHQETTDMKEIAKNLLLSNTQYVQSHRNDFKKELESLQMEVGKYIEEVKSSWSETGLTVKIHYKSRRYCDFPELSDIAGYTVYCPKGILFLDINNVPNGVEEAMSTETTQILCDLDQNKDLQHVVYLASNNMFFTNSGITSFCAHERILSFLHDICEECNWLFILLSEAKCRYRREEIPSATTKFDHPFFELEAIMQHKGREEEVSADQCETSVEKFWKDGEEVLNAVGPLLKILNIFDDFVPNIGYFYGAMERAEKRIEHCKETNPEKFMVLWERFRSLKMNLIMPIHVVAAYLNPSCAAPKAKIKDDEVIQFMKQAFPSLEEDDLKEELSNYITCLANSRPKECHPVRWWEEFGGQFSLLKQIAIRILSQLSNCLSHFSHKSKFEVLGFEELHVLRLNLTMMNVFKELEERGNPYISTGSFPWPDDVPDFIVPYITGWTNVVSDGNCGFRVIAEAGFGGEDSWAVARREMLNEIEAHVELYVAAYGYKGGQWVAAERIGGHMRGPAPRKHWLETPSDLFSAATVLNFLILNLATVTGPGQHVTEACVSIFPLRARSSFSGPERVIGIAHVNKNHYVLVHLQDQCPLPPLDVRWEKARQSCVVGWEKPFAHRFATWHSLRKRRGRGL